MDVKFAQLDQEQITEVKKLEDKLQVTLLAYDHFVLENQSGNSPDVVNPS